MKVVFRRNFTISYICIFLILLCALGFPGSYSKILGDAFSVLLDYFCFGLQILLMFSGLSEKIRIRKSHISTYLFLILIFVMSMIVTKYPVLQIISCVRFSATACFGLWLAEKYDVESIVEITCNAQCAFVIFTILFTLLFTADAFQTTLGTGLSYCGIYSTKNTCASELAFGIIMMILLINIRMKQGNKNNFVLYFFILIQAIMLLACKATGAIFCVFVSVMFILFFSKIRFNMGLIFSLGNLAFLLFVLKILPHLSKLMSLIGKDITLTGRTDLWKRIIYVMMTNKMWTGYGYAMFWRNSDAYTLVHKGFYKYSFGANMTSGSHNAVIELFANLGLIGIISFFAMLIISMRGSKKISLNAYKFIGAVILFLLIHGLSERSFGTFDFSTLFLFMAIGFASKNIQNEKE